MKITQKMIDALNKQINEEMYSAYLYLDMASFFEADNLKGFAHWMKKQANEEMSHALKFVSYLHERGAKVQFFEIKNPTTEWKNPLNVFKLTLEHEEYITSCIEKLVDIAKKENDKATESFLQWYINEQVEEEANATEILDNLKRIKDSMSGLLVIDSKLGARN